MAYSPRGCKKLDMTKHVCKHTLISYDPRGLYYRGAALWTAPRQAPLSMRLSRQEYWSGLPGPPPGDLPDPGVEPESRVSCTGGWVLGHQCLGSPIRCGVDILIVTTFPLQFSIACPCLYICTSLCFFCIINLKLIIFHIQRLKDPMGLIFISWSVCQILECST